MGPQVSSSQESSYPFDRVEVRANGDGPLQLSPSEFFALPLAQRIEYVVQRKAAFFANGEPVDARSVLSAIRKARASLH